MSEKKGFGSTVLGWFVVPEDGGAQPRGTGDADELIAKYASETPAAPPPEVKLVGELPKPPGHEGGAVDFPAVFRAAGINDEEQGRVAKAGTLLTTLDAQTPKDLKKQIVEASLKTFGYPVDKIIEAGAQEIQALEVYIQACQKDTQSILQQSKERLAQLEAEMASVRKVMSDQVQTQESLSRSCNQEKLRVQEVLEFFGQEAVARVVQSSPRLHEPQR